MEQTPSMESTVHYDAFISYRHIERDALLAKELHTMLEHYHIPAKIQKSSGKKRIARVFRDREELPLSSDLTANIQNALKHSDYLIVICSPESLESLWVQREIELFLQFHDREHVLTLLAAGEPEQAFPSVLCSRERTVTRADGSQTIIEETVEPLAADVRGANDRERKKKLKQELLRLLAPMLSCTYDDLRQRHREYIMRKALAASCLVAVLAVSFMLYVFRQASLIRSQYQEAHRSQARYLSRISGELLGQGDRMGALQTALAIAPDDPDAAQPVVPEQLYALNSALYSYRHTCSLDFLPDRSAPLDGEPVSGQFSPEGRYYLSLDKTGAVCVLDGKQGDRIRTIQPQDFTENQNQPFEYCCFVSKENVVLASPAAIILLAVQEEQPLRIIALPAKQTAGNLLFAASGQNAAVISQTCILIYDLSTGKCLTETPLNNEFSLTSDSISAALSPDGTLLAVALSRTLATDENGAAGILLLSAADGSMKILSKEATTQIRFTDDTHLAALHCFFPNSNRTIDTFKKERICPALYDLGTGRQLWKGIETETIHRWLTSGLSVFDMYLDEKYTQILAVRIKKNLLLLDSATGTAISNQDFPTDIIGIEQYDSRRILVGLADGTIYSAWPSVTETPKLIGTIDADIKGFAFSPLYSTAVQVPEKGQTLVFSRFLEDEAMKELATPGGLVLSVDYDTLPTSNGSRVFRCISCFGATMEYSISEVGSDQEPYRLSSSLNNGYIQNIHIGLRSQKPVLYYTMTNFSGGKEEFCAVDLDNRRELFRSVISDATISSVVYSASMEWAIVNTSGSLVFAEITENGFHLTDRCVDDSVYMGFSDKLLLTADDQYLLIVTGAEYEGYDLRVWDIAASKWVQFGGSPVYKIKNTDTIALGEEKPLAAVYTSQGTIDILELSSGTIQNSIPFNGYRSQDFAFFDEDHFLITYGGDNILSLWDLKTDSLVMQEIYDSEFGATIQTDSSSSYFGLKTTSLDRTESENSPCNLRIYSVDENHHFYPYADIENGYASFEAQEILCTSPSDDNFLNDKLYSTHFYSYPELKKQAEESLQGKALSDTERRKYFISD